MGTTATLVVLRGQRLHLAHIGDSRASILRDGRLALVSYDHTLVNEMIATGKLLPEEVASSPHQKVILQALGMQRTLRVDQNTVELCAGDVALLCTDGLSDLVEESSIAEILQSHTEPQEACRALVEAANAAGGHDNVTVAIIDFEGNGLRPPEAADVLEDRTPYRLPMQPPASVNDEGKDALLQWLKRLVGRD